MKLFQIANKELDMNVAYSATFLAHRNVREKNDKFCTKSKCNGCFIISVCFFDSTVK